MKKILSNIHILLTALCLCFAACERNEEVIVCTVTIADEKVKTEYPIATITCALQTEATLEEVVVHLSQTQDFADYIAQAMTLQEDGTYTTQFTNLSEDVLYYIRYEVGNRYTSQQVSQLTTLIVTTKPELITTSPKNISMFSAMVGGEVLKDNGYDVTSRGVCYGVNENPTLEDNTILRGQGLGTFTCEVTGLTSETVYYVRAFATNANGTTYGQQVTFTTKSAPAVYTDDPAINITAHSAMVSGGYTSDGGEAITDCGICYSLSSNPTTKDSTIVHTVAPSFECTLENLRPNSTYYARAYVINKNGTAYGNEITFTTTTVTPVVATTNAQAASTTSILANGSVISDGGYTVIERGICYSTNTEPTISNNIVKCGEGIGEFTCTISDLQASTTYYVRAYAINSEGMSYGDVIAVKL